MTLEYEELPTMTILNWDAVAVWSWKAELGDCAICRNHMLDLCIECQDSTTDLDIPISKCTITSGACGHNFHLHCIERWIKTRMVCPLDNKPWSFTS